MVVCESGREPEAVHQFYLVHQLGIVVLEILQVEIVETDWGIFLDLGDLVDHFGGIALVVIGYREVEDALTLGGILPVGC